MSKITAADKVIAAIKKVAEEKGISPQEVKKSQVSTYVTDHTFKQIDGGFSAIKKAHFPITEKDLEVLEGAKDTNAYIRKLESRVGKQLVTEAKVLGMFEKHLKPLPKITPKKTKVSKTSLKREIVAMLNDTHIGLIVDPEEIGHANSFNFKEAGRRIAMFIKETIDYKPHARDEVQHMHLVLNGDLIAGVIHALDTKTIHLSVHQFNGAVHIFTHAIDLLAREFPKVTVHGLAGNHCRVTHKNHGGRAVAEVYDSYANYIFYALSVAFRNYKHVEFNTPKTAYGFINLPGGRAMFAHGDHIFTKALGNVGSTINVKGLSTAIKDFNAGEIAKGNDPIKLLLLAHVHSYAHFITNDGVEVLVAPSLVGLDQYAHSLTINNNFIGQVVFESTPKFVLGDCRVVRLNDADKDESLDKLIPVYNNELKW